MNGTLELLGPLSSTINEICASSGTPGLSLGVLHHGPVLFRENYGYRDVEARLEPDSDTIYGIASLTKAFTSSVLGILVDEGRITLNRPVRGVASDFHRGDQIDNATIVDLLAQRTGMARSNQYWFGLLLEKDQILPIVNYIKPIGPFPGTGSMNNWHSALAGEIVESLRDFWNDMNEGKVAKPYVGLRRQLTVFHTMAKTRRWLHNAMGIRSSVNDLLTWFEGSA